FAVFVLVSAFVVQAISLISATRISCSNAECHFSLSAQNGTECVSADLSLSVNVPYRCANFTSDCLATVTMPELRSPTANETTKISGRCGNETAWVLLTWNSGRFRLRFDFRQESIAAYNFINRLTLIVDLRDPVFANASIGPGVDPVITFVSKGRTFLFASPLGLTFKCESLEFVQLHQTGSSELQPHKTSLKKKTQRPCATVMFPKVQIDVFKSTAPKGGLLEGPFLCEADSNKQARSTVIMVISGILAVCVLIIVCGFLATRLNKSSAYSSVE
uniref:CUB domain-containing protein n=1 Tax=Macrostomum lignano TaxID=282301 RepID=A0A1I8GTZ6_9PLAT